MALGTSLLITSPALAYEVKSGDTMGKIAKAHSMDLQELSQLNPNVDNLNLIYVGQDIKTAGTAQAVASQPVQAKADVELSGYEADLLARLVRAEAQSESYAGKVAVAQTVLNRVDSDKFPDSISAVIHQKGQFSPVTNGSINRPADNESKRAVAEAMSNRVNDGSLFFYNANTASSRWLDSMTTVKVIGNHTFKK